MFKNTTSGMNEELPFPIETVEVDDAQMAQLALDFIAAVDKKPYVVNNVQDPDNKTYYEWTGLKWVPWNDLNQANRWCVPDNQIESFALTSDVGDMGQVGEPIVFANPDILGAIRLLPNANNWDITGLLAPDPACPNKIFAIRNTSPSNSIRFRSNNGGSLAANRFLFSSPTLILPANETLRLMYNHTIQRWFKF